MSEKMNVEIFRKKMMDVLYGFIDEEIDECEKTEASSFVISFEDGSKFEVHIVSIERFRDE